MYGPGRQRAPHWGNEAGFEEKAIEDASSRTGCLRRAVGEKVSNAEEAARDSGKDHNKRWRAERREVKAKPSILNRKNNTGGRLTRSGKEETAKK
eukprot:5343933-Pleurochrysis_carterae.AAC.2